MIQKFNKYLHYGGYYQKIKIMGYYILAIVIGFISGFCVAAFSKDNINIGFGNQTNTFIDGVRQEDED